MGPTHNSRKLASSCFPDYGAIFIANNSTRKECFERGLFGLPSEKADFVKKVKRGMLLFLYDYQDKKLYGVFEASTDGAMNIVPDAYKSAFAKFPAQVRFSVLWRCAPVPSFEFRDAIKENYYAPHKFNFGLSRDQVQRLLFLFKDPKFEVPRSQMKNIRPEWQKQKVSSVSGSYPWSLANISSFSKVNKGNQVKIPSQAGPGKVLTVCDVAPVGSLTESMPKTLESLVVSDCEMNPDVEDYIPLPSIDSDEIEDQILDTFQLEADSASLQPLSEAGASLLQLDKCVGRSEISAGSDIDDHIDDSIRYQAEGLESGSSMPASCCSGSESSHGDKDDETKGDSVNKIHGMYSDSGEKSLSVFRRLAGLPEMMVEKSSNSIWLEDILNSLDKKHEMWHNKNTSRAHTCHGDEAFNDQFSVFSRLGDKVGKSTETVQGDRVSVSGMKRLDEANIVPYLYSKYKGSDTLTGKGWKANRSSWMWHNKNTNRTHSFHEDKAINDQFSVFSRLGHNVGKATGAVQGDKVSVSGIKCLDKVHNIPYHDSKRKGCNTVAGQGQKRNRSSGKCIGGTSHEIKTCYEPNHVQEPAQRSSVSAVNCKSNEAQQKTHDISSSSDSVKLEELQSAQTYMCADDTTPEDPLEMLLKQYREYKGRSS